MRKELTPRQAQILRLVAEGKGDKEIARCLGLSINTVRTHLQRLYRDHGIRNRAEAAVAWAAQQAPAPPAGREPEAAAEPEPAAEPRFRLSLSGITLPVMSGLLAVMLAGLIFAYRPVLAGIEMRATHGPATPAVTPPDAATPAAAAPLSAPQAVTSAPPTAPPVVQAPVTAPAAAPTTTSPGASQPPPAAEAKIATARATSLVDLVNADRAGAGLPPLAWHGCLEQVATSAARQMAAQGSAAPAVGSPAAAGCGKAGAPVELVAYWSTENAAQLNAMVMRNPTQRTAILGPHAYGAAAWAAAPSGVVYLVVELA